MNLVDVFLIAGISFFVLEFFYMVWALKRDAISIQHNNRMYELYTHDSYRMSKEQHIERDKLGER